jgi:FtsH-binding integral membrane protein
MNPFARPIFEWGGFVITDSVLVSLLITIFLIGGGRIALALPRVRTTFEIISSKNFSYLGGALSMGLFVVIGASLLNLFVGSSVVSLAISSVAVLLFGAFVLYDTSRLLHSDEEDAVGGAIQLYLNFLNIFLALLRILSSRRN